MKIFCFAIVVFTLPVAMLAQKDTTRKLVNTSAKVSAPKITVEQEQWVRNNYQHIAGMKKDSAKTEIRKNFSTISNASIEYIISKAAKLNQGDKQKHQAMVQQMLKSLNSQKSELAKKIAEKERELKKTKDKEKINSLNAEISDLKNKMKELDKEIKYLHPSK